MAGNEYETTIDLSMLGWMFATLKDSRRLLEAVVNQQPLMPHVYALCADFYNLGNNSVPTLEADRPQEFNEACHQLEMEFLECKWDRVELDGTKLTFFGTDDDEEDQSSSLSGR